VTLRPFRLVLDAHCVRDPVDVVEVRHHLDRVVDGGVVETMAAERLDVGRRDGGRRTGELGGEVAQRACSRVERRRPVVDGDLADELVGCALGTEVVGVGADSVVAVVLAGDDDREQLALPRLRPDSPNMISRYRCIDSRSTAGRRLIACTMLKTLPARPIAASNSSLRRPAASSTRIRRRYGTRRLSQAVTRSPTRSAAGSRLATGASGHDQRESNAHEGLYAKLKSTTMRPPSSPRSAPLTVSST
jgi:hypothetical protein